MFWTRLISKYTYKYILCFPFFNVMAEASDWPWRFFYRKRAVLITIGQTSLIIKIEFGYTLMGDHLHPELLIMKNLYLNKLLIKRISDIVNITSNDILNYFSKITISLTFLSPG